MQVCWQKVLYPGFFTNFALSSEWIIYVIPAWFSLWSLHNPVGAFAYRRLSGTAYPIIPGNDIAALSILLLLPKQTPVKLPYRFLMLCPEIRALLFSRIVSHRLHGLQRWQIPKAPCPQSTPADATCSSFFVASKSRIGQLGSGLNPKPSINWLKAVCMCTGF